MLRLPLILGLVLCLPQLSACDGGSKDADAVPAAPAAAPQSEAAAPVPEAPKAEAVAAEAPKGDEDAEKFGAALVGADALPVSELLAEPRKHEGKMVRVEGMVTSVCTKRGCWFEMAGDQPGAKIRFKVKDGTMVFPPTAKGKIAVAEGEVSVRELSMEQSVGWAKHMAEDAGKTFDPAEVKEPLTIVQLDGKGAEIRVR